MDHLLASVTQELNDLKEIIYINMIRDRAEAIFVNGLRDGKDVAASLSDRLYAAFKRNIIAEDNIVQVLASDMLWGGQLRAHGAAVVLMVEASWTVEETDVARAVARAAILSRVGLSALPVVAGKVWDDAIARQAVAQGVVLVRDRRIDSASWKAAVESVTNA